MYIFLIVILFYYFYLWVVFAYLHYPFHKKRIYPFIKYLFPIFCHYHYMLMAVIQTITLFPILYFFFHLSIITRTSWIAYIYLLTQLVLRPMYKKIPTVTMGIFLNYVVPEELLLYLHFLGKENLSCRLLANYHRPLSYPF